MTAGLSSINMLLCSSRKYPFPPHGRLMEIPRGRGFQKPNFFNESMTLTGNFQRGGGSICKTFHGRGMDIFWNNTFSVWEVPFGTICA